MYFHSIEYHLESQKLLVWEKCTHYKEYPTSAVAKLLLGKDVPANRVCSSVPTCVQSSVSFIVSMKAMEDPKDLIAEENWVWGLRSLWCQCPWSKR